VKIVTVVGARPQFVKAAPVSQQVRKAHTEVLLHTGQHYDYLMSEVFFRELGIPAPDYNLGVGSGGHGQQTGEMLARIEEVLLQERPAGVLVYGDTNSTLAGALAAAKLHIPVAHVEAGLRSFNREMPEEINRVLSDHISDLLFCPTATAAANLAREGIAAGVHQVGDVMYDAVRQGLAAATRQVLERLGLAPRGYLLATIHRPSNTDDPAVLAEIVGALGDAGETVVLPAHPRTQKALRAAGVVPAANVRLTEPVSYLDMLALERDARMVLTDSGGVQKEAYWLGVPCVTLRGETEWVETVEAGWNLLVGNDRARIAAAVHGFRPAGERPPVFGDGHASERIAELL